MRLLTDALERRLANSLERPASDAQEDVDESLDARDGGARHVAKSARDSRAPPFFFLLSLRPRAASQELRRKTRNAGPLQVRWDF